jgi:tetratricopeptide (TPR) repeat protein
MSNKDLEVAKQLRTKILKEVDEINNMKYTKSRKKRAEALRKQLKNIDVICGAIDRSTGKICTNPPYVKEDGSTNGRCLAHGGNATGAVTEEGRKRALANLNPRARFIHGLYSRFVMTQEELEFYTVMMNHYIEVLDLDPANILLLDRALRNFILNQRKEIAEAYEIVDESQSYNDYDSKFLRYMQALALDRRFKESKDNKDNTAMIDLAVLLSQAPAPERKPIEQTPQELETERSADSIEHTNNTEE